VLPFVSFPPPAAVAKTSQSLSTPVSSTGSQSCNDAPSGSVQSLALVQRDPKAWLDCDSNFHPPLSVECGLGTGTEWTDLAWGITCALFTILGVIALLYLFLHRRGSSVKLAKQR
jgi:hypothetical protein